MIQLTNKVLSSDARQLFNLVFNKANSFSFCSVGSFNCLIKCPATLRPPLSEEEPSIGVPVELQIFNYLFQGTRM